MSFAVSAPGRICLFGEHQDYLGLPVIAAAINLRMEMKASTISSPKFHIDMPDIGQQLTMANEGKPLNYQSNRDYFRSVYNVLLAEGLSWPGGLEVVLRSRIPINAGTSSSAAMVLCWTQLLLLAAGDPRSKDPNFIASTAHRAEVLEFSEPCGMMDQFSCSFGNVIHLETKTARVESLTPALGNFVLGDSGHPKDTVGVISQLKDVALQAITLLQAQMPHFQLHQSTIEEVQPFLDRLPLRHREVLEANLIDRDLLRQALPILRNPQPDHQRFGQLLLQHHLQLSSKKQTSTPKIDAMISAAMKAGALGGKINGSGGGGCMFAYAPDNAESVANAIRRVGGKAWIVSIDQGTRKD